jgi:anti-sigma-K factor RskA
MKVSEYMVAGRHVLDLLADYALGSLEETEARRVAEHLASCDACRAELAELETLTGLLAFGAADAQPAESVRRRLMERVPHQQPVRVRQPAAPRPWMVRPLWAIVGLVVIAVLAISNGLLWQRLLALDQARGQLAMRAIELHSTGLMPGAGGYVIIGTDGQNGAVVVDQLAELSSDQTYQLWLIRAGQSTSGALFTVDETGYRGARIVAPDSLLTYNSVQITIEPAAGSAAPTGQLVLDAVLDGP